MVQKKTVDWSTTDVLTTPSQKRLHIESCKDWLLAVPDDVIDETEVRRQDAPTFVHPQRSENIGMVKEHIYMDNKFVCFVCGASGDVKDGCIVNANPFARAQCMLVCADCKI